MQARLHAHEREAVKRASDSDRYEPREAGPSAFAWATFAYRGSSSREIRRPSSGSARASQIVL
jgi:hypothetical protein